MQSHSRDATVAMSVAKRLLPHFVKYAESHFVKYVAKRLLPHLVKYAQPRSDWYTPFDKYAVSQSRSDYCAVTVAKRLVPHYVKYADPQSRSR